MFFSRRDAVSCKVGVQVWGQAKDLGGLSFLWIIQFCCFASYARFFDLRSINHFDNSAAYGIWSGQNLVRAVENDTVISTTLSVDLNSLKARHPLIYCKQ